MKKVLLQSLLFVCIAMISGVAGAQEVKPLEGTWNFELVGVPPEYAFTGTVEFTTQDGKPMAVWAFEGQEAGAPVEMKVKDGKNTCDLPPVDGMAATVEFVMENGQLSATIYTDMAVVGMAFTPKPKE
jgi:hypothetical protein